MILFIQIYKKILNRRKDLSHYFLADDILQEVFIKAFSNKETIYVKIDDAENHALQCMDECNLEHPKVPNKPHTLVCGKTQGLFNIAKYIRQVTTCLINL